MYVGSEQDGVDRYVFLKQATGPRKRPLGPLCQFFGTRSHFKKCLPRVGFEPMRGNALWILSPTP